MTFHPVDDVAKVLDLALESEPATPGGDIDTDAAPAAA
jgi:hypothetical protein